MATAVTPKITHPAIVASLTAIAAAPSVTAYNLLHHSVKFALRANAQRLYPGEANLANNAVALAAVATQCLND